VPNGGKSAALNFGIASATHDLIVMVDADTVFEPDSLRLLVQPMADMRVGAVAGNVKVGNRDQVVAEWQHLEYVIGFNLDRRMFDMLQCMPTVPGAIGAFRRSALQQVGGLSTDTLAEDTDLTIALIRAGWRVVYEENARAWTEAPATLPQLVSQRSRWSYGTIQAMWKHRRSVIERGPSGRFGRVGLPALVLFQIVLPLTAPIIDVLVVYGLLFGDQTTTAYVWLGMLGLQALTAAVAFILDREKIHPLWLLPLQQLAYRQLMYMVLVRSVAAALTGVQMRWHKLRRAGSAAVLGTGGAQKVS
jgi:cellulose synthase/poly-beta-1,6-N-acetylglucosamine synthase-like glycosyltransferase